MIPRPKMQQADLSDMEISCAKVAAKVAADAGGRISFDGYDAAFGGARPRYCLFAPITWCNENVRIRAAAAAVLLGLIRQTADGYYEVVPKQ